MERSKELLLEYELKFKELPPFIKTLPYESEPYQFALEYALSENKKLTYDSIAKLFEKVGIRYDYVSEDTEKEDDFKTKLYSQDQNNKKSF